MVRVRPLVALVVAALVGAACASATTANQPTTAASAGIEWRPCVDLDGGECATFTVPIDHADADGPTIDLALFRWPALGDRRGVLLVNPGGPGASGVEYVHDRSREGFPEGFDVIGFDPRGFGRSAPLECVSGEEASESLDEGTIATSDQELERWLADAADLAERCAAEPLGGAMGSLDVARDLDLLRAALGEEQISYVGFSYGGRLGWTYAAQFPDRVRAMVLDAPEDPTATIGETIVQQASIVADLLAAFSATCLANPRLGCPADVPGAVAEVLAAANRSPIPTTAGEPALSGSYALNGILTAFYAEDRWPDLADALTAALDGEGLPLLELSDAWQQQRGRTDTDATAAPQVTFCADRTERPSPELFAAVGAQVAAIVPPLALAFPGPVPPCHGVAPPADDPPAAGTVTTVPVLVVAATGDVATPYAGAVRLTSLLDGAVLLTRDGTGHTSYGLDRCIDAIVTDYLTDLTLPAPGTTC